MMIPWDLVMTAANMVPLAGTTIPPSTTGSSAINTPNTPACYRVWFADRSCLLVDAASEDEARSTATSLAIRNGHAPNELGGRIASVEVLR